MFVRSLEMINNITFDQVKYEANLYFNMKLYSNETLIYDIDINF